MTMFSVPVRASIGFILALTLVIMMSSLPNTHQILSSARVSSGNKVEVKTNGSKTDLERKYDKHRSRKNKKKHFQLPNLIFQEKDDSESKSIPLEDSEDVFQNVDGDFSDKKDPKRNYKKAISPIKNLPKTDQFWPPVLEPSYGKVFHRLNFSQYTEEVSKIYYT